MNRNNGMGFRGGRGGRGKFHNKTRTKYCTGPQYNSSSRQIRFNTKHETFRGSRVNEHDDRTDSGYHSQDTRSTSRPWYKPNRGRRQPHGQTSNRPARKYQTPFSDRNRDDPDSQWFKITVCLIVSFCYFYWVLLLLHEKIPHANKLEKDFVLRSIESMAQLTFTPYNYHIESGSIVFFVLGVDTAEALKSISRRISTPNGHKLMILTNRSAIPPTPINDELTDIIKNVMSTRYDVNNKLMDLSKFREDLNLQQLGLYVPLSRPNMLNLIVGIIIENTPDIVALNLRDNKLTSLEPLLTLAASCNSLKAIDLSLNQIRNIAELDHLKGLELLELALDGNPICDSYEDQAAYISCIRSKFGKLVKLDGEELPATIGFDVEQTSNLPAIQPSFMPEDTKQFILGFFEAFYNIYDSEDRQGLIQAYHDQAFFSVSVSRPDNQSYKFSDRMIQESRNLLRVKDFSVRNKLLKQGKVNIVSALCDMTRTKHEPNSFIIDVPFCNNNFIHVVVNGVYREMLNKNHPIRAFCRTFYIVPQPPGFVIVNDMLLLTNATVQQIQKYGQNKSTDKMMVDATITKSKSILRVSGDSLHTNEYESVVQRFMTATGMNKTYAAKCLEENNFNIESAYSVFQELQQQNAIPSEAFS